MGLLSWIWAVIILVLMLVYLHVRMILCCLRPAGVACSLYLILLRVLQMKLMCCLVQKNCLYGFNSTDKESLFVVLSQHSSLQDVIFCLLNILNDLNDDSDMKCEISKS